jgi:hypothetical protein
MLICQALPGTSLHAAVWHLDLATLHTILHAHGIYRGNDYVWPEQLEAENTAMQAKASEALKRSAMIELP